MRPVLTIIFDHGLHARTTAKGCSTPSRYLSSARCNLVFSTHSYTVLLTLPDGTPSIAPWVASAVNLPRKRQCLSAHQQPRGFRVPPRCRHHLRLPLCPPRPRCPDITAERHLYASGHIVQEDQVQLPDQERNLRHRICQGRPPGTVGGPRR